MGKAEFSFPFCPSTWPSCDVVLILCFPSPVATTTQTESFQSTDSELWIYVSTSICTFTFVSLFLMHECVQPTLCDWQSMEKGIPH